MLASNLLAVYLTISGKAVEALRQTKHMHCHSLPTDAAKVRTRGRGESQTGQMGARATPQGKHIPVSRSNHWNLVGAWRPRSGNWTDLEAAGNRKTRVANWISQARERSAIGMEPGSCQASGRLIGRMDMQVASMETTPTGSRVVQAIDIGILVVRLQRVTEGTKEMRLERPKPSGCLANIGFRSVTCISMSSGYGSYESMYRFLEYRG